MMWMRHCCPRNCPSLTVAPPPVMNCPPPVWSSLNSQICGVTATGFSTVATPVGTITVGSPMRPAADTLAVVASEFTHPTSTPTLAALPTFISTAAAAITGGAAASAYTANGTDGTAYLCQGDLRRVGPGQAAGANGQHTDCDDGAACMRLLLLHLLQYGCVPLRDTFSELSPRTCQG